MPTLQFSPFRSAVAGVGRAGYNAAGMIARLNSVAFNGIEAVPIEVEVDVSKHGFAGAVVVGLPDAAVKESIERVRSAVQNSGYEFPRYKTVINLAPADIRKASGLDLRPALRTDA